MSPTRRVAGVLVLDAVLAVSSFAQVYRVRSDGTGDFTDLQVALDTVPVSSTLLLDVEAFDPVTVTKSVTIIGTTDATGTMTAINGFNKGGGNYPASIDIEADSTAVVRLVNVHLIGAVGNETQSYSPVGILGNQLAQLEVDTCLIEPSYWQPDGGESGWPVDGIDVGSPTSEVVIRNSVITCAPSWYLEFDSCDDNWVYGTNGGDAVHGPSSSVIMVLDSVLSGGDGGDYKIDCVYNCPPEPDVYAGNGGDGVSGFACVYVSNSILVGGHGGKAYSDSCDAYSVQYNDGSDGVDSSTSITALPNLLTISGDSTIGGSINIDGSGYTAFQVALVFVASSVGQGAKIHQGNWFLAFPFSCVGYALTDVSGGFSVTGDIPDDSSLIGFEICLQAVTIHEISEPGFILVRG